MTQRWKRLFQHFSVRTILYSNTEQPGGLTTFVNMIWAIVDACFLLADCLYFPEILIWLSRIFKANTRKLNARERHMAESIFGKSIDYQSVWLDDRTHIACRQFRFAYVGFTVVNCWGPLSDAHFIHEMVHVWQYQQLGSVYIPRALRAQWFLAGYDYGGIEAIQEAVQMGRRLQDFNYEQQGDIVADYFCLKNNLRPRWCSAEQSYVGDFEALLKPEFQYQE